MAQLQLPIRASGSIIPYPVKYLPTDLPGPLVAIVGKDSHNNVLALQQQRYVPFGQVRSLTGSSLIGATDFGCTYQRKDTYIVGQRSTGGDGAVVVQSIVRDRQALRLPGWLDTSTAPTRQEYLPSGSGAVSVKLVAATRSVLAA